MNAPARTLKSAPLSDGQIDVSDEYGEIHDPEGEFGINAKALFILDHVEAGVGNDPYSSCTAEYRRLIGMTTDDGFGEQFHDRETTIDLMGWDWVERFEATE